MSNTIFYDNRILLDTFGFFDLLLIVLFVILMNDEKTRLSDAIFLFCLTLIGIITPFLANKTGVFTFESKLIIREICFAIMIGECIILAKRLNNDKLKFKSIISGNTLVSIASTNINEVLEFSKSYFDISSLALFVVLFAVVYVGGSMFFLKVRYILESHCIIL